MQFTNQLPSVLIHDNDTRESLREETIDCSFLTARKSKGPLRRLPLPSWLSCLWSFFLTLSFYLNLCFAVPLDLLSLYLAEDDLQHGQDKGIGEQDNRLKNAVLAAHPRLPLVAVAPKTVGRIQLYGVEGARLLWNGRLSFGSMFTPLTLTATSEQVATATIEVTCLEFSSRSQLAVGLSSGHLLLLRIDLSELFDSCPGIKKSSCLLIVRWAKLIDIEDWNLHKNITGSVSNIRFSPTEQDPIRNPWLAVTTTKAGVWIWNCRSDHIVRLVDCQGIAHGCLHWIDVEPQPQFSEQQVQVTTPAKNNLNASTLHRWQDVFGDPQDISMLDKYFAATSTSFQASSICIEKPNVDQLIDSPNSTSPQWSRPEDNDKFSLMVIGTQDGKIICQVLWHSSRTMKTTAYYELSANALALPSKSQGAGPSFTEALLSASETRRPSSTSNRLTLISTKTDCGVSHLFANLVAAISKNVTVDIVAFLRGSPSPTSHIYTVVLPLTKSSTTVTDCSSRGAIFLANCLLHAIGYSLAENPLLHRCVIQYSSRQLHEENSKLISIARSPRICNILWTVQQHEDRLRRREGGPTKLTPSYRCFLAPDSKKAETAIALIPLVADSRTADPVPLPKIAIQKGHYTSMLERAERRPETVHARVKREECRHEIQLGQVAWGKSATGKQLGVFFYGPVSENNDAIGVGMFEVVA
ncbi:MAG: hypothetical protein LQ342_000289 [Letrouitia transgressa]|nr:MAG: hypothetical protein LQ342_000289 [Letrouitia transgressa]